MLNYNLYINDILRAIKNIEDSINEKSFEKFSSDKTLVDATAMRLQIIGESLKKIPSKFKRNKEIDWKALQNLRNIISHAYFKINEKLLFDITKNKIPVLKEEIKNISKEL
ncbi:hypothetical protein A3K82_03735 [Candidatus Pacearchaeota archaeon RBG_19FT_COMBO_34_9]|nr:MAG: hypothetical protein A3K82_03735 [Candidatus Pacearchaeota archaeon RBG_19FT_COMBO_34_9]OGJ16133.1 MAG: hypothetical protein A3K74_02790 [Candidatus Pacearchaeota archaeon RBG_13_33_26]